jgi:hypothetical protein
MKRKRLTKPRHQQNKNVLKNYLEESRVTSSTPAQLDCTPTILSVLLCMKKEGYSQATLRFASKALKFLNDPCNLDDPESVKEFIADYNSANSYKRNLCYAYNHYLEFKGLEWNSTNTARAIHIVKPLEKLLDVGLQLLEVGMPVLITGVALYLGLPSTI